MVYSPGLCSNAIARANYANAAFALALAFDCPAVDAFAIAFAFDSSAFDWNQMRIKCETNAIKMRLYYCCLVMFILLVCLVRNKPTKNQ